MLLPPQRYWRPTWNSCHCARAKGRQRGRSRRRCLRLGSVRGFRRAAHARRSRGDRKKFQRAGGDSESPQGRVPAQAMKEMNMKAINLLLSALCLGSFAVQSADTIPTLTFPPGDPDIRKLPWPHQPPSLSASEIEQFNRAVWVINNNPLYQADEAGDWAYFHGGLDIVLTNGTKIYAIEDGWVKSIGNSAITIASLKDGAPCYGWSYAHLDNFAVREGDFVRQGTLIGEVNFHGLPHTHLEKVFSEGEHWPSWRYICFPDDHFSFYDNEPPVIQTPFHFFENNSDSAFVPQSDGSVAVRGDVDIVVAMRDGGEVAHSKEGGFGDRLAVTRVEYTIRPTVGNKDSVRRFSSFDFRKLRIKNGVELDARSYSTR